MLEQLKVENLALSQKAIVDFPQNMICITGETGAGKSLIVDALSLVLGAKADANMIRAGQSKCQIEALFSIENKHLKDYLKEHDLLDDDSLILKRIVNADGKSKAYINDSLVTLSTLKEIGSHLVSIHGQHASIGMLSTKNQLSLLDSYAKNESLLKAVKDAFYKYSENREKLTALSDKQKLMAGEFKTLRYDLDELKKLDLSPFSYKELEESFDRYTNGQKINDAIALSIGLLDNDQTNVIDLIESRLNELLNIKQYDEKNIGQVVEYLQQALENLNNAKDVLADIYNDDTSFDPNIGEKMGKYHDLARKYGVSPENLYKVEAELEQKIEGFLKLRDEIPNLTKQVQTDRANYDKLAKELTLSRNKAAESMSKEVTDKVKTLSMADAVFKVNVISDLQSRPMVLGRDSVEFLFSANLGQEPKELSAVASGGELSRLALVIEVLTSSNNSTPTMVFDEVDTGISGRTASSVGALLRELSKNVQVLTVTHLPQVAANAQNQFLVTKYNIENGVNSKIEKLDFEGRVLEISRMMGGNVVTNATKESARQLLNELNK